MNASVAIPYRRRDTWTHTLYEHVVGWWARSFPDWPLTIGDGGHPFSRAHARNEAWRNSTGDVLVFCDADTIPLDAADVARAVEIAADGGWTLPARYWETSRQWTNRTLAGVMVPPRRAQCRRVIDNSPGGLTVVGRAALDRVGGWDEAFTGWGWEDTALRASLDALWGQHVQVGEVAHLWHHRPHRLFLGQPDAAANRARFKRYAAAWASGTMEQLYEDLGRVVGAR